MLHFILLLHYIYICCIDIYTINFLLLWIYTFILLIVNNWSCFLAYVTQLIFTLGAPHHHAACMHHMGNWACAQGLHVQGGHHAGPHKCFQIVWCGNSLTAKDVLVNIHCFCSSLGSSADLGPWANVW